MRRGTFVLAKLDDACKYVNLVLYDSGFECYKFQLERLRCLILNKT